MALSLESIKNIRIEMLEEFSNILTSDFLLSNINEREEIKAAVRNLLNALIQHEKEPNSREVNHDVKYKRN
jgi:hypothetical protein